jgi:D-serine deaminase-like pyridoxal phosphate-dependent protein
VAVTAVQWREGGLGPAYAPGAGYLRGGVDERKYRRPAMDSAVVGLQPAELDTPCLTVDLTVLDRNITMMHRQCRKLGIGVRAHFKAHKMTMIALRQAAAGATFACQKIGEAEALLAALPEADLLIPYNIVGAHKLRRLAELMCGFPDATISVSADSHEVLVGLTKAVRHANRLRTYQLANLRETHSASGPGRAGLTIGVLVELDSGTKRCGVQTPREAVALSAAIAATPELELLGLSYYDRDQRVVDFVAETRRLAARDGLALRVLSGGGTGTQEAIAAMGFTEARMGCYCWEGQDRLYMLPNQGVHELTPERCPLRLWTTVVSTSVPGQVVVDVGSKGFAAHAPGPLPRAWAGACVEHPDAFMKQMSVEHGVVDIGSLPSGTAHISVGDVLSFIPTNGEPQYDSSGVLAPLVYTDFTVGMGHDSNGRFLFGSLCGVVACIVRPGACRC